MKLIKTYISPILATLCWAFSYIWTNIAFESYSPITIVTLRVLIAAIFMLAITLPFRKLQKIQPQHLLWFFGLSFLEPFGYFLCEVYGLSMVSPTLAAVVLSTIPLFSPIIAYFTLGERVSKFNIIGILISLTGVLAITFDGNGAFVGKTLGIILVFGAVFISIFYSVSIRKLSKYYTELSIVTYQNLSGILLFLPLFFIVDYGRVSIGFHPHAFLSIVLLGVFSSALAFIFYTNSLNKFGVTRTNIFLNLLPAITAFLSVSILGESISAQKVIGILVVVFGLFIGQMSRKRKVSA